VIAAAMEPPPFLSSLMLNFTRLSAEEAPQLAERLRGVAGVQDVVVLVEEKVAYLKVDRDSLDEQALAAFPATAIKA
ncbi:MAG: major facilitator superfamily 1, partial [Moraxellaceae bacterium]|nr:major facilitator superfamily 1 [Moraxellaceae bacterium]